MATFIGIGFSQNIDPVAAAKESATQAVKELEQDRIDFAILFSTKHYDPKIFLPIIHEYLDKTKLIGSSTAGIILGNRIETRGIGVLAIYSEEIRFQNGYVSHLNLQNIREAGAKLAKNCVTDYDQQNRKLFLLFTDGLLNDITGLMAGVQDQIGPVVPIVGAGSSDDFHFFQTYQYYQDKFMTQSASGLSLGGKLNIGISCKHGWRPLGKPRTINETEGNIIKTIAGKEARFIYDEYFDEEAKALNVKSLGQIKMRYPLGIHGVDKNDYLLRNVISTLDDGSIVCQDAVPKNSEIHIMIGNKEFCLQAAEAAALDVKEQLNSKKPTVVLVMESLTRFKLLGKSAYQEINLIKKVLGNPPVLGMYSCNEIFSHLSPEKENQIRLQNDSIIVLAFY